MRIHDISPLLLALCFLSACQSPAADLPAPPLSLNAWPEQEQAMADIDRQFATQSLNSESERKPSKKIQIQDVQLADSNAGILGATSPGALSFAPDGQPVKIRLRGKLCVEGRPKWERSERNVLSGLIQATFLATQPRWRVLLDDAILLPPAPGAPLSKEEATVLLDPRALTDLAISRLHRLTLFDGEESATVEVRVANAQLPSNLQPVIIKAELTEKLSYGAVGSEKKNFKVLHDGEDEDGPRYLRVEGYNLPVSFYAHWAKINGVRTYAHATWVTDEAQPKTVLFLHLPEGFVTKGVGKNSFAYANPFGFQFGAF